MIEYFLEIVMEKIRYKDLADYVSVVERYKAGEFCLFRGQPCKKPLLPGIARKDPKDDTTAMEKAMLSELRRMTMLLGGQNKADDWDLLVFAQHHGMATRLMDWTSNPLAGLWFACSGDPGSSGYVYLVQVSEDLLLDRQAQADPFTVGKTRVLKPNLNNARIVAQGGWFTAHRYSKSNKRFVKLETNSDIKHRLVEIEISPNDKSKALKHLDKLGINSQSMFPDLDGVCRYLNWKHDVEESRRKVGDRGKSGTGDDLGAGYG